MLRFQIHVPICAELSTKDKRRKGKRHESLGEMSILRWQTHRLKDAAMRAIQQWCVSTGGVSSVTEQGSKGVHQFILETGRTQKYVWMRDISLPLQDCRSQRRTRKNPITRENNSLKTVKRPLVESAMPDSIRQAELIRGRMRYLDTHPKSLPPHCCA